MDKEFIDIFTDWQDEFGMINAEKNQRSENGILWTLESILAARKTSLLTHAFARIYFKTVRDKLKHEDTRGLWDQTPFNLAETRDRGGSGEEPISHDNLTAITAGSYIFGDIQVCKDVWRYLYKHLFTYDSTQPGKINFRRIMHPRDIIFYGALAGNTICKLLLFVVGITNWLSCRREPRDTSGKLLAWVRFQALKDSKVMNFFEKRCDSLIEGHYGADSWHGAFAIYFPREGHPTTYATKLAYNDNKE